MITLAEFNNGLRILRAIDAHELGDPEWWPDFRRDPYLFLIRCADDIADKIWGVMLARGVVKRPGPGECHGDGHEWERLYGLGIGHVMTESDVADIKNLLADWDDEMGEATNAHHEGRIQALHDIGGDKLVAAANAVDSALADRAVAQAMKIFDERRKKLEAETAAITNTST